MPDQTIVTEETTIGVVETASDQIAVTSETVPSVIEFGSQGPQGVQGEQGVQGIQGVPGGGAIQIPYIFSTLTADADPGNGYLRLSNATQNLSTVLRADLLASDGTDWSAVLATFADSTNVVKGHLRLSGTLVPAHWLVFTVTSLASPAGYKNVTIANVGSSSASPFADGESITLEFTRSGDRGSYGGAVTIPYTFSTTTADADPGNGVLRLDNATQNLATTIRADLLSSDGTTWTSVLDTFDLSTSTTKAQIRLSLLTDPTKWLVFNVTAMAAPAGYRNITVANVGSSAASPFANGDALLLTWTRVGDKGSTGATGAAGLSASVNRLINGDFRVWQRGATAPTTADNAYGPDRWRCLTETTATGFTISEETSDLPTSGSRGAAKLVIGASNNTKNGLFYIMEGIDVWDLRGAAVSLSFSLKVASTNRITDVRVALLNWTGAEDATSADPISVWGAAGTNPTYTGSWAAINTPANITPSESIWASYKLENQTVSSTATNLGVFIWIDDKTTTAGDAMFLTDVQLEKGTTATTFERQPLAASLARCQRYYCKTFAQGVAPVTAGADYTGAHAYTVQVAGTTAGFTLIWRFPVTMRAVPTVTTYNPGAANAKWRNASTGADSAAVTVGSPTDSGTGLINAQVAGDLAAHSIYVHATAVAEL